MAKTRRKQPTAPARPAARQPTNPAAATASPAPAANLPPPTADARAAERIARQRERAEARRREDQTRQIRGAALIGIPVVIIIAVAIWWLSQPPPVQPGRQIPIAGWEHIQPPATGADYTTVPPTSGQHYPDWFRQSVSEAPLPHETQVHNLEHGQIMVQYTCADCPELATQLKGFAARYPKWVIVAPYPDPRVGARIVLTAWGRIDTFDEYDEQRIVRFIEAYKNKGREQVVME